MRCVLPVACLVLCAGCHRALRLRPPPEPEALLQRFRAAHRGPQTLTAEAKAFVEAPENAGRYALQISVRRPRSLRIEALTPLGDPAALLVADAGRFALLDLRNGVFYRGPSTPENLSRLLPAPLKDDELVALFLGAMPELPGAEPVEARIDGEAYRLTLSAIRAGRAGDDWGMTQEVWIGDDLRLIAVRRNSVEAGQPRLLWSASLEEHDDASGEQMPRLLRFSAPEQRTSVELRLKNRLVGKPPPAGAFQLGAPEGMRIVEVG